MHYFRSVDSVIQHTTAVRDNSASVQNSDKIAQKNWTLLELIVRKPGKIFAAKTQMFHID